MRRRHFLSTLFSALFSLAARPVLSLPARARKRADVRVVNGWLLKEEDL